MKGVISFIGLLITSGFVCAAYGIGSDEQNEWEVVAAFSTTTKRKAAETFSNFYIGDTSLYYNNQEKSRSDGHIRTSSSGSIVIHEDVDCQGIAERIKENERAPFDLQAHIDAIKAEKGQSAYTVVSLEDVSGGSGPCVSISREQKESCKKGCCLGSVGLCLIVEYCLYMAIVTV